MSEVDQRFLEESLEQAAFDIHSTTKSGYIQKRDLIDKMVAGCKAASIKSNRKWGADNKEYVVKMVLKLQNSVGLLV